MQIFICAKISDMFIMDDNSGCYVALNDRQKSADGIFFILLSLFTCFSSVKCYEM